MPYLKCVDEEEAKYVLEEIHEGVCGDHAGPRSLVSKVIRAGYFWPIMQVDTRELVKECDKCQRFGNVQRLLAEKLTTMSIPHCANGQGEDIVINLSTGRRWTFPNLWHLSHFLTSSLASIYIVGQK